MSTAPASTPAATGCTPKAWQAKNLPAFKDKDNLTEEFLQHFEPFPKPKATPWVEQPVEFRNTEQCDEERLGSRLQGRPQHEVLARHEGARARSRASYCQGDHGPAVAALRLPADQILANMSDNYQHQVYTRMQAADVAAGKDVVRRAWEKLFEAGRWSKLVHFFGFQ